MSEYTIGALGRETGTKLPTIRYYEQIGLLSEPARTAGNQRRYTDRHRARLAFIRHARELGFALDDVRELLTLADQPEHSCDDADAIARRHLAAVEDRLARLAALRSELARMIDQCAGGEVRDCRVIEVLTDHGQCLADDHRHAGDALDTVIP